MVDREKFGERRVCPACGCKFYDKHRNPPLCPRCGTDASVVYRPVEKEEPDAVADLEEEEQDLPEELAEKGLELDTEEEVGDEPEEE
jgi:uncharacterized protein (TIGR02300 family)